MSLKLLFPARTSSGWELTGRLLGREAARMWEEEQKREVATRRRRKMTSRDAKNNSSGTDAKMAP